MKYEWDPVKAKSNVEKHGFGFLEIAEFDWTTSLVVQDTRDYVDEVRFIAFGRIGVRLCVCVFTDRKGWRRVIMLRKANNREIDRYEEWNDG